MPEKGAASLFRNVIVQRKDYYPFYSDKSLQEEGRTRGNSCKSSDFKKMHCSDCDFYAIYGLWIIWYDPVHFPFCVSNTE